MPKVRSGGQFWGRITTNIREKMIPFQLSALKDEIPGAQPSHAIENFEIAAGLKDGQFYGMVFQDSDLGKWIEAAAYSLALQKDEKLENEIDRVIGIIAKAQQSDGYLNTYFTVKEPDMRWKNLRECHEMYCAGHLLEGAIAYYQVTGKAKFLDVMKRMIYHIYELFGPGKKEGYPGHPILELALYRLYYVTKDEKYSELANLFIDRRGGEPNYFMQESEELQGKEHFGGLTKLGLEYSQAHKPIREQDRAVGHAVRALYLYSGAADAAAHTKDAALAKAMEVLWDNVVNKQMYITGGLGQTHHGEAFAEDYELPNDTVYAETCASIAFVFWAKRMLKLRRDGKIVDEMEKALYNTVLSGANLNYDKYFYVNPLEVIPGISGKSPDYRHVLPERPSWFGCACCPPNMARLLLSVYDYAYTYDNDTVFIDLYADGSVEWDDISITHKSDYPWDGALTWNISCGENKTVALRIPGWSRRNKLFIDGKETEPSNVKDNYYYMDFAPGTYEIRLEIDMSVRRIYSNPKVRANANCVALMRGPIAYCFEGVDNEDNLSALRLPRNAEITVCGEKQGIHKDMCLLLAEGQYAEQTAELYSEEPPVLRRRQLTAIPYFTWANRGLTEMRVWINE